MSSLTLYVLMPDKAGNIWFTTGQGVVGTIAPDDRVRFVDTNDLAGTGVRTPQPDGDFQSIANSHAVDEGDSAEGSSGVYILTTHKLYRFGLDASGNPKVEWDIDYDRGAQQKSGQVSHGSGTYEKRSDGWYLTGLDASDLNRVRFAARVGVLSEVFNNHYAALSLDPDGNTVWFGSVLGVTKVTLTP